MVYIRQKKVWGTLCRERPLHILNIDIDILIYLFDGLYFNANIQDLLKKCPLCICIMHHAIGPTRINEFAELTFFSRG